MYRLLGGPRTTDNGGKRGELQKCGRDELTEGGSGMADCDEGEGLVSSGNLMNTTTFSFSFTITFTLTELKK